MKDNLWIRRYHAKALSKLASQFPAVIVSGPRQSGKTSLLTKTFPDAEYVTLDYPQIAESAESNPEAFLAQFDCQVILDEVQYAPSLFRYLKIQIDRQRQDRGKYLLTGSQNFSLMEGVSESLAGRCGILNLPTLSYAELKASFKDLQLMDMLLKGGYPELWANAQMDFNTYYSSYVTTYLERDLRNIVKVQNLRDFNRFIRSLAMRTGQILVYADLAKDIGIAPSTAREWISALQTSNLVFLVEPYFGNIGKRLIKSPKIYFSDVGLAAFLCGISTVEQLLASPIKGHLWETLVIGEIVRSFYAKGLAHAPIYFWQTSTGVEVDCVIQIGGRFRLFEIKFAENPAPKDYRGLKSFAQAYGDKTIIERGVICQTPHAWQRDDIQLFSLGAIQQHLD